MIVVTVTGNDHYSVPGQGGPNGGRSTGSE